MMKKKIYTFLAPIVSFTFLLATKAHAQGLIPESKESGDLGDRIQRGEAGLNDIPLILLQMIDVLTKLAGTIAVIFIIYAGFQMILSGITEDKAAAKSTLTYAVAGLVVTFMAWVIVNLIQVQLTS
jgi:type IV secretory pathway VirB2 component (pilin)